MKLARQHSIVITACDHQQRSMGADINSLQQQMNSLEGLVRAMAKHQGIPVGEDPDQTQQ